jgi:beta-carotene hydroxylase
VRSGNQASPVTEIQALRAAKALQPRIAWWTIIYAAVILGLYGISFWLAFIGLVPFWLAMIINALLVYAAYTPLHEATHRNIASDDGAFGWINHAVGFLIAAPMIHNYSLHRTTHIAHHKHTYDPAHDADHWVKGSNAFETALRCITIVYAHYRMGFVINRGTAQGRKAILLGSLENAIWLAFPVGLIATGYAAEAVMLIILPALLGSGLLAFFFDYAVHYPKVSTERFRRGRIYRARGVIQPLITTLYVGQNYHQIHHLYPWVPFYRYPRLFTQIEPLLRAKGTPIVDLMT